MDRGRFEIERYSAQRMNARILLAEIAFDTAAA